VVVLISGSPLAVTWADQHATAILQAWYPGEEGGSAIADVLFGDYNPAGRRPVTFPRGIEHVPEFTDYGMRGRTSRYLEHEPLYPFGYGLSYTRFEYSDIRVSAARVSAGESVEVSVTLRNAGSRDGEEVVQLYVEDLEASVHAPHHSLRGFRRVALEPGESERVVFEVTPRDLSLIDEDGQRVLEPGRFRLWLGGSQPDARSAELTGRAASNVELEVTGERRVLAY
jgi:beta-glucosidase